MDEEYRNLAILSMRSLASVHKMAIPKYRKTNDVNPLKRGEARMHLDQYREAIEDYTEALRLSGAFPKAYRRRGDARLKIGDTAGAEEDYARASYP
jgi:tetratricopeptide (TPR) repeat protein